MSTIKGFDDTIAWYNANAAHYAAQNAGWESPKLLEEFAHAVGAEGRVLDAGCAAGRDTFLLKKQGLNPMGVDISANLLDIARKKFPDIEFQQDNFLHLHLPNESFDGVWAHASLLHLETVKDVKQALHEFNRVLKPEGIIHVYVKQQMGSDKTSVVSDSLSGHDRFFQWFTKKEINDLLTQTGYAVLTIEDNLPDRRPEVKWIYALAKKVKE